QAKVLDFGLAQLREAVDPAPPGGAARAGTPLYMAPELFDGRTADPCTDVYAAGVMLFETLAPPGSGAIEARIACARLAPPLRRLLHRATAPDRARRFHDAGELLAALVHVQRQLAGRGRRRAGLAIAGALVAVAGAVTYRGLASAPRPR